MQHWHPHVMHNLQLAQQVSQLEARYPNHYVTINPPKSASRFTVTPRDLHENYRSNSDILASDSEDWTPSDEYGPIPYSASVASER